MEKVYKLNSDKEINQDFRMANHDDNRKNNNKEHKHRSKIQPIKRNKNNKPSSPTVKETSLKETHTKENNKEDKDETMDTI